MNNLTITDNLLEIIIDNINDHLDEPFTRMTERTVLLEAPSVDMMNADTNIFVQPNFVEMDSRTTCSDEARFHFGICIFCKRDTRSNLTRKIYSYENALYHALRENMSLNSTVSFTEVEEVNYYQNLEGNENVKGVEISIACVYERDF